MTQKFVVQEIRCRSPTAALQSRLHSSLAHRSRVGGGRCLQLGGGGLKQQGPCKLKVGGPCPPPRFRRLWVHVQRNTHNAIIDTVLSVLALRRTRGLRQKVRKGVAFRSLRALRWVVTRLYFCLLWSCRTSHEQQIRSPSQQMHNKLCDESMANRNIPGL